MKNLGIRRELSELRRCIDDMSIDDFLFIMSVTFILTGWGAFFYLYMKG